MNPLQRTAFPFTLILKYSSPKKDINMKERMPVPLTSREAEILLPGSAKPKKVNTKINKQVSASGTHDPDNHVLAFISVSKI